MFVFIAEVQLQQLNIRLSYHDWIMFQTILESFPKQANKAMSAGGGGGHHQGQTGGPSVDPVNIRGQVGQLMALGFSRPDCQLALEVCQGRLDEAALWLTHNASPAPTPVDEGPPTDPYPPGSTEIESYLEGSKVSFKSLEFKSSCVNICIIDDCKVVISNTRKFYRWEILFGSLY